LFDLVEVIKRLGSGGQAEVFSVIDPDSKEKYAIKRMIIGESYKGWKKELGVVLNENLHHINIVRYLTFFEDMPYGYLIMELCEEGNLEEYSKKFMNNIIPEEVFIFYLFFYFYFNKNTKYNS
jgi:serine/threonine protein kinase